MAKRLIYTTDKGVKVYRDTEWAEYSIKCTNGDTYHTDDKEDAIETAKNFME